MKKPILITFLFFVLTSFSAFSQAWVEQHFDPETGLRTGKINGLDGTQHNIAPFYSAVNSWFDGLDLEKVNLSNAILTNSYFRNTNLKGANLQGAKLNNANLSGANLSGANLSGANLFGANLVNSDLTGANLTGSNLEGANLEGATLTDAIGLIDPKDEKIAELEAQLSEANAEIDIKDALITELSIRPSIEEIQDGRLGSIVLTPIPNTNTAILSLDIEQSNDLKTWTLYRKILESIPIPDGKKFYRFALDK